MIRITWLLLFCAPMLAKGQQQGSINWRGSMRESFWQGKLEARLKTDTLSMLNHVNGIGPVAGLKGELLLRDGQLYQSRILPDGTLFTSVVPSAGAPFFVYSRVSRWKQIADGVSVSTTTDLEQVLSRLQHGQQAFIFRVTGTVDSARIHCVNLPEGKKVQSPDDAHEGLRQFTLTQRPVELTGFFSTQHTGIFVHHTSRIHAHLLTQDPPMQMGHLEEIWFQKNTVKIWLNASR